MAAAQWRPADREYLTETEVQRLMKAATMILVAYRHGLRVSELVELGWDQADFRTATLHVPRVKQGTPSTHPIVGDELRALQRLQREQEPRYEGAQAYLGHRNIQHTVRYTELSPNRFKNFWRE